MNDQNTYYLGIDAGGSQTSAIIVNQLGELVGQGSSGGANPHNTPMVVAMGHIQEAVSQAVAKIPQSSGKIARGCLGIAGFDTPKDKHDLEAFLLKQPLYNQTFGATQLYIVNDALLGLALITNENSGVVVVSGTGAHVLGRNGEETTSAGCWGYLLGDQGSGFAVGHKIVKQVVAEFDGRQPQTPITQAALEVLGLSKPEDLLDFVYQKNPPIQAIASLSKLLLQDDMRPYLQQYLDELISALLTAFSAVVDRLSLQQAVELPVAMVGGLLRQDYIAKEFTLELLKSYPRAKPQVPAQENTWGAIKFAQSIHHVSDLPKQSIIIERSGF